MVVAWSSHVVSPTCHTAPKLCFTHKPGCMYVSDIPVQEWEKNNPAIPLRVIPVSASFFSCLGASVVEQVAAIQEVVSPPSAPVPDGDLLKSVLALSHSVGSVVLATLDSEPDCLLGAIILMMALGSNGTGVHFVCPGEEWAVIEECLDYCATELPSIGNKPTHSCASEEGLPNNCDCLVLLGAQTDGVAPAAMDAMQRTSTPLSIAVAKAREEDVAGNPPASAHLMVTASSVAAGGLALAAGVCAVSRCPVHWRYRNHAIGEKTPPTAAVEASYLPTDNQVTCNPPGRAAFPFGFVVRCPLWSKQVYHCDYCTSSDIL